MRTKIFFFLTFISVAASATVTVTPISTDYAAKEVTFNVEWTNSPTVPYNNRVWIWIDFCSITGTTPGSFAPATITSPTKTGGNGTITGATARGFFIEYGTTNAGATVTATLSNAPPGKFNWCVYGSDTPPNVTASGGTYTLHGTPPFILTAASGATQTVVATNITTAAVTITPVTLTDQTGCPGIFCLYTGSDLVIDETRLCQQRTGGEKNWEAYIKDSRDGEYYKIVQYSDGVWWWADDYRGSYGYQVTCSGVRLYSATSKSDDCPSGWRLPTRAEAFARFEPPLEVDGWGGAVSTSGLKVYATSTTCNTHTVPRCDLVASDVSTAVYPICSTEETNIHSYTYGRVRCIRQL